MSNPRMYLSASPQAFAPIEGSPRKFWKPALKVGTYKHPVHDWTLPVTEQRIDAMVKTFGAMHENGVTVDATLDHSTSARDKIGKVTGARRNGPWLELLHEFADDEAVTIAQRNQETSVEIEPELVDGHGKTYTDAIVANSIVRQPVVPGQGPFLRVAASRGGDGGTGAGLPFVLSSESPPEVTPEPKPKRSEHMFTDEQLKALGIEKTDDQAALATSIVELATKGKSAQDQAEQITALTTERDTFKGQVAELQKGKTLEIDQDVLEETADNRQAEIDRLVENGNLTPNAATKIAASLIGTAGKRPALCLSRKAATHAGLPEPIAKSIIEALKENKPADLKQKAGPQIMSLSRSTPGGENSDKPDDWVQKEVDEHNKILAAS